MMKMKCAEQNVLVKEDFLKELQFNQALSVVQIWHFWVEGTACAKAWLMKQSGVSRKVHVIDYY